MQITYISSGLKDVSRNPLLPKGPIKWRTGPSAGKAGVPGAAPLLSEVALAPREEDNTPALSYQKDTRGRKPKEQTPGQLKPEPAPETPPPRAHPDAGKLSIDTGPFFADSVSGWGSNIDMVALAHGPVGCGAFPQTTREETPGFVEGVEGFASVHACTDLKDTDLENGGNEKLSRALNETATLFPLARGVSIVNEDPVALIGADIDGIAREKTKSLGRLVIPLGRGDAPTRAVAQASGLKAAASYRGRLPSTRYDVALPFYRGATSLVWIVSKLLIDIGLNPVHEFTYSSTADMARIHRCKLIIGFAPRLDVPADFMLNGAAQQLRRWFDIPIVWTCFLGPSATDASLRAIAAHFDRKIQRRAEEVIAANRRKIDAVIARYRPRLQGKLVVDFDWLPETLLEKYRLLGMRVGNATGWTGKTGVWRTPRLVCDRGNPGEQAIDSYIREAKPDFVLYFKRDEHDWRKRAQPCLEYSSFFDRGGNAFWGYDGFACFASALDRALNAPWRKLLKPPWPNET